MKLEEHLRQLRNIQPDMENARISRSIILTTAPRVTPPLTLRAFLGGLVRSGSAMALTGFLLLIAVGGFSLWKFLGPLTGLDAAALRAEAQAIDIQIHLADLQYRDTASSRDVLIASKTPGSRSAVGTGTAFSDTPISTLTATGPNSASSTEDSSSGVSSTVITVDDVLTILSR